MFMPPRHTAPRTILLLAVVLVLGALATPAGAATSTAPNVRTGSGEVAGQVVVRYRKGVSSGTRAAVQRAVGVGAAEAFAPHTRVLKIRDGESVEQTVRELRARPEVAT